MAQRDINVVSSNMVWMRNTHTLHLMLPGIHSPNLRMLSYVTDSLDLALQILLTVD